MAATRAARAGEEYISAPSSVQALSLTSASGYGSEFDLLKLPSASNAANGRIREKNPC